MTTKIFSAITSVSLVVTITAASLCIIGIAITGVYPGIAVLVLLPFIPLASKYYINKRIRNDDYKDYYTILSIINLLSVLVVLWMSFVIVHDRVLKDCC